MSEGMSETAVWHLTLAGDIREVQSIHAIICLKKSGARLLDAKRAVEAAMEGKVGSVGIPVANDEDALVREMQRLGIAMRKTDGI